MPQVSLISVMALAGVFVRGVTAKADSGEHGIHSTPEGARPTDIRAPRGSASGPGLLRKPIPLASEQASKQEREREREPTDATQTAESERKRERERERARARAFGIISVFSPEVFFLSYSPTNVMSSDWKLTIRIHPFLGCVDSGHATQHFTPSDSIYSQHYSQHCQRFGQWEASKPSSLL